MTARERFLKTMNFEKPADRMPALEWAPWWDLTIDNWEKQGMPKGMSPEQVQDYFGLDKMVTIKARPKSPQCPKPEFVGGPIVTDEASYEKIKPYLFTDSIIETIKEKAQKFKDKQEKGDIIVRLWLDGFFWFPRMLFGIEGHLYSFYDNPELMHRINSETADFNIRVIKEACSILTPDMVGIGEDMSYNLGPMLSYEMFNEFLKPYYDKVVPIVKSLGVKLLIDSDGDVTSMIPWLYEAGIEGVYPLERQAGIDIVKIRQDYPDFIMMGGFNKLIMADGEEAMRTEFERIFPVIKSGGYIPSVDHQTPPNVSIENYKIYVRLLKEYCEKAVK